MADLEWIDDALDEWPCTLRWDTKGLTPSARSVIGRLWDGIATQRVVLDDEQRPRGLLQLADVNLVNGTALLEAIAADTAAVAPSAESFITHVTQHFPLRIVYLYSVDDSLGVNDLIQGATEVGRLAGHHLRGQGRYVDLAIYEVRLDDEAA